MRKFGDTYYWYGSANRFTDQTCYSSKDLLHWTYRGVALRAPSTNRVDVVYNETTKKYVMFLKTGPSDGTELGIAISAVPEGPFTLIGNSLVFGHKMGDMSVYQDDDEQDDGKDECDPPGIQSQADLDFSDHFADVFEFFNLPT